MNIFESEFRKILKNVKAYDIKYIGRACYFKTNSIVTIKAEFVTSKAPDKYDSIKMSAITKENGIIDTNTFLFRDLVFDENSQSAHKGGEIPHIKDFMWCIEWAEESLNEKEYKKLSYALRNYADIFMPNRD